LRADLPFLERLGEELTRPVQPAGACDRLYSEPVSVRVHQKKRVRWRGLPELGQRWHQSRPVQSHSGHRRDVALYNVSKVSVEVAAAWAERISVLESGERQLPEQAQSRHGVFRAAPRLSGRGCTYGCRPRVRGRM